MDPRQPPQRRDLALGLSNGHSDDRFDENDDPVCGIRFHKSQALFVSGGDDRFSLVFGDFLELRSQIRL